MSYMYTIERLIYVVVMYLIRSIGTGDDNCHYQGVECLVNELIRQNKQFRMFAYPNRFEQNLIINSNAIIRVSGYIN
jgi:hypothetical protein